MLKAKIKVFEISFAEIVSGEHRLVLKTILLLIFISAKISNARQGSIEFIRDAKQQFEFLAKLSKLVAMLL